MHSLKLKKKIYTTLQNKLEWKHLHKNMKYLAFKWQVPIKSKTVMHNILLEQVNTFTYLGSIISYEEGKDITSEISIFLKILWILKNAVKPKLTQRQPQLVVCVYYFSYRFCMTVKSGHWKQMNVRKLKAAEIQFY
jgi:hypothetical protein